MITAKGYAAPDANILLELFEFERREVGPHDVSAFGQIIKRRRLAGSLIGGIKQTQEMPDYCAEHGIVSDVELISIDYFNEAYERMIKGDFHNRFVIDTASLQ